MRLNYTMYDVRWAQDIVNLSTSHCNIMLLADHADGMDGLSQHPYIYTHVLGIFHVNATYVGPSMINYCLCRIDFLWGGRRRLGCINFRLCVLSTHGRWTCIRFRRSRLCPSGVSYYTTVFVWSATPGWHRDLSLCARCLRLALLLCQPVCVLVSPTNFWPY